MDNNFIKYDINKNGYNYCYNLTDLGNGNYVVTEINITDISGNNVCRINLLRDSIGNIFKFVMTNSKCQRVCQVFGDTHGDKILREVYSGKGIAKVNDLWITDVINVYDSWNNNRLRGRDNKTYYYDEASGKYTDEFGMLIPNVGLDNFDILESLIKDINDIEKSYNINDIRKNSVKVLTKIK